MVEQDPLCPFCENSIVSPTCVKEYGLMKARSDMLPKMVKALKIVTQEMIYSGYFDNQQLINRSNVALINARYLLTDKEKADV